MFGLKKKKGPTQPFADADNCKIVKADPRHPNRVGGGFGGALGSGLRVRARVLP